MAQDMGLGDLETRVLNNIFFDTCVYHQDGIDMLLDVIPTKNILFASEMIGAVRGIDPRSGHYYDDTKRYIDANTALSAAQTDGVRGQRQSGVLTPEACEPPRSAGQ